MIRILSRECCNKSYYDSSPQLYPWILQNFLTSCIMVSVLFKYIIMKSLRKKTLQSQDFQPKSQTWNTNNVPKKKLILFSMTYVQNSNYFDCRSSKSSKTPPTTPPIGGKSSPSTRSISPHPKSSTSLVLVPSNHVPEKEKKRKEPSNSRQKKFHRHFDKVPKEERVLNCEYDFVVLMLTFWLSFWHLSWFLLLFGSN